MRCAVVALVVLAGCGRFAFDPLGAPSDAQDARLTDTGDMPDPSLVVWLAFEDDPSDGVLDDSSVNHFQATCTLCPVQAPGKRGMGARFDGDTATIPYSPMFDLGGGFTVTAWAQIETFSNDEVPVARPFESGMADSFVLAAFQNGMTCLETAAAGPLVQQACGSFGFPVGEWHHLAGVWNGTNMEIWVDGFIRSQTPGAALVFDQSPLVIGSDINLGVPALKWHGLIDDVRLYSRVLTAQEIAELQ